MNVEVVDNARVSNTLSSKRKRVLIIDSNKMYVLNKCSKERVPFSNNNYTYSWTCKNRNCSGRANSQRVDLESDDIHVNITKGIFYILFISLHSFLCCFFLEHAFECGINGRSVIQRTCENAIFEKAALPGMTSTQAYQSQVMVLQASNPEVAATFKPFCSLKSSISRSVIKNRPDAPTIDAGNPVNLRLKKYRNAENRIKASREDYVAQRITTREFLQRVSIAIVNENIH
jgi:hypothetical protein